MNAESHDDESVLVPGLVEARALIEEEIDALPAGEYVEARGALREAWRVLREREARIERGHDRDCSVQERRRRVHAVAWAEHQTVWPFNADGSRVSAPAAAAIVDVEGGLLGSIRRIWRRTT